MKRLRGVFKSALTVAATVGALTLAPGTAHAGGIDFTVDEGAIGAPTNDTEFTADDITGKYQEQVNLGPGNTFSTTLVVNFTAYVNNALPTPDQLGAYDPGEVEENDPLDPTDDQDLSNLYSMYALVTVTGTFGTAQVDPNTVLTPLDTTDDTPLDPTDDWFFTIFDPTSATATVYVDPLRDTVNNYQTALFSGSPDDAAVMTANMINTATSTGSIQQNFAGDILSGSYALVFTNPSLIGIGPLYWIPPAGLTFNLATASGDVDPESDFPLNVTGDTSITLQAAAPVPEPASLVLLGTGLLAASAARRKKQNKQ